VRGGAGRIGGAVLALALLTACGDARATGGTDVLRVGFITPDSGAALEAARGVELGAAEAAWTGELLGRPLEVETVRARSPREAERAVERLARGGATAIVGGFDEPTCRTLGEVAAREGVLFLNLGCRGEALRDSAGATTYHVEASEAMYRRALGEADGDEAGDIEPVLWHGALTRFGAEQLNERFERRFSARATPAAWAGWMALKVIAEAALRTHGAGADVLAAHLAGEAADFDGHKGRALRFGTGDHQLQQPLYLLDRGRAALRTVEPAAEADAEWAAITGRGVPEGQYIVVSNEGSRDVLVLDAATRQVVSRIALAARPRDIRAAPDGRHVYVALSDDAPDVATDRDGVAVIDLRTGQVVAHHPAGTDPEQFALSPDLRHLYAANEDAGTATITDLTTGRVLATLVVGIEPEGVAVSPDGRWVYVTAETSNTVSVIDTRKNDVVASFLVGARPRAAVFAPDGRRAYVTNEIGGTLSIIDVARHVVIAEVQLDATGEAKPVGVAVSPDGRRVYVANGHAHTISVVDAEARRVVAEVPVGRRPWGIELSPDGRWAYTANGLSNDVSVVDTETNEVIATVAVGQRPWGIAVTP
jgi:PQQ-dependent catabolism-associated beta-propeller protein